jgi:hypothetical protein
MNTIHARKNRITAAISAVIVGGATPALLFLGAGTALAIQDVSEHGGIAAIDYLPLPRDCGKCGGFNPQPDPPGNPDPSSEVGLGSPEERSQATIDPTNPYAEVGPHVKGVNR